MKVQHFLFLILAAFILGIWYFRDETILSEDPNQEVVDSLKRIITKDSLDRVYLKSTIAELNEKIELSENQIKINQQKLKNLTKKYNERTDSLSRINVAGVQEYFSKRYQN